MSPLSVGTSSLTHALEKGEAKLWLLLVGVNQYWDENLPSLRYPAFDCQGLEEALAEATQAFPRKEVLVHHDFASVAPNLETVRASLRQIVREAKPQDTILFYFSGHGVLDLNSQEVVLCLADTNKDDLLGTGLGMPELLDLLGNSAVHRQMLWLDACHSGNVTLRGAKGETAEPPFNPTIQLVKFLRQRATQNKGFYALLSCDQNQRSWEFPELQHGLFTYYLMQGLRGEAADSQGVIEADGLYKYVYRQTLQYIEQTNQRLRLINQQKRSRGERELHPEYPLQTPKRIVEGVGELVLGLKPEAQASGHQRRALVIDGLSNSKTTVALSKVLRSRGGFELEYLPQPGKAWSEVRNAIQNFLRSPNADAQTRFAPLTLRPGLTPSVGESRNHFTSTATILLYLRGSIEELEDGEAWLVLGDNVRLSRSWLRQELRRSGITQQIVVLDCPGASSLSDWVEELKLGPDQGQCLLAAAAPLEEPERFAQSLLDTLVAAKPQVGLSVAGWIAQLQNLLARNRIPLHVLLSGVQGVIEVLPASSESVLEDENQSRSSGSMLPAAVVESIPNSDRFQEQYSQLEQMLRELVGPIAPTLLRQVAAQPSSPQTWVENLARFLPAHKQRELEKRSLSLLRESIQPHTNLSIQPHPKSATAPSLKHAAIPEREVHQCEQALANFIGPIATFVVQNALKSHPQISRLELVEILAAKIPDRQKAVEFRQHLLERG